LQIHSTRAMNEPYTTIKAKDLAHNSAECGLLIFNGLETGRLWRRFANYAERGLLIDKGLFF